MFSLHLVFNKNSIFITFQNIPKKTFPVSPLQESFKGLDGIFYKYPVQRFPQILQKLLKASWHLGGSIFKKQHVQFYSQGSFLKNFVEEWQMFHKVLSKRLSRSTISKEVSETSQESFQNAFPEGQFQSTLRSSWKSFPVSF